MSREMDRSSTALMAGLTAGIVLVGIGKGARYAMVLGGADFLGIDQLFD